MSRRTRSGTEKMKAVASKRAREKLGSDSDDDDLDGLLGEGIGKSKESKTIMKIADQSEKVMAMLRRKQKEKENTRRAAEQLEQQKMKDKQEIKKLEKRLAQAHEEMENIQVEHANFEKSRGEVQFQCFGPRTPPIQNLLAYPNVTCEDSVKQLATYLQSCKKSEEVAQLLACNVIARYCQESQLVPKTVCDWLYDILTTHDDSYIANAALANLIQVLDSSKIENDKVWNGFFDEVESGPTYMHGIDRCMKTSTKPVKSWAVGTEQVLESLRALGFLGDATKRQTIEGKEEDSAGESIPNTFSIKLLTKVIQLLAKQMIEISAIENVSDLIVALLIIIVDYRMSECAISLQSAINALLYGFTEEQWFETGKSLVQSISQKLMKTLDKVEQTLPKDSKNSLRCNPATVALSTSLCGALPNSYRAFFISEAFCVKVAQSYFFGFENTSLQTTKIETLPFELLSKLKSDIFKSKVMVRREGVAITSADFNNWEAALRFIDVILDVTMQLRARTLVYQPEKQPIMDYAFSEATPEQKDWAIEKGTIVSDTLRSFQEMDVQFDSSYTQFFDYVSAMQHSYSVYARKAQSFAVTKTLDSFAGFKST